LTFLPYPGVNGPVEVTGVVVGGFPLTLPSTSPELTVGTTVAPLAGSSAIATAPTIPFPASGTSGGFYDVVSTLVTPPGVTTQFYKVVLPAPDTVSVTTQASWTGNQDIDIAWRNADGTALTGQAGGATLDNPEVNEATLLPGTYLLRVSNFGPAQPGFIQVIWHRH
jgi:hypothetical protein